MPEVATGRFIKPNSNTAAQGQTRSRYGANEFGNVREEGQEGFHLRDGHLANRREDSHRRADHGNAFLLADGGYKFGEHADKIISENLLL